MLFKFATAALTLALVTPAFAQEPNPIDIAILTCIGPGYTPEGDPFEVLDSLGERSCKRVCKASAMGCKAVVKAIDKCGVSFLKTSERVGIQICRGWGYTAAECRGIHAEAKADIDWWKAQGRIERDECDREVETLCMSRCQSPVGVNYVDLVPVGTFENSPEQAGGAIVYLDLEAARQLAPLRESPQGQEGVRVIAQPVGEWTNGVIAVGELTNGVIDPLQVQTGETSGFIFLETEHVSQFRELEPLNVREHAETVNEGPRRVIPGPL
jgi:hypothetical protein